MVALDKPAQRLVMNHSTCRVVSLLAFGVSACAGTSVGNPGSKDSSCDEETTSPLTGVETDIFVDETGEGVSVDVKLAALEGTYETVLEWIEDTPERPRTELSITVTPVLEDDLTLHELGSAELEQCYERSVSFPVQISVSTGDGLLNAAAVGAAALLDNGWFYADISVALEDLAGLSEKFPEESEDEESKVEYQVVLSSSGELQGSVYIETTPITESLGGSPDVSSTSSGRRRVAQFPAGAQ